MNRLTLPLIAALGAATLVVPADGATIIRNPNPIPIPCATPTLAQCQAGTYPGGSCLGSSRTQCNSIIGNAFEGDYWTAVWNGTTAPLIEPAGMSFANQLQSSPIESYDQRKVQLLSNSTFAYSAMRHLENNFASGTTPVGDSAVSQMRSRHAEYNNNGAAVDSCLEYVYEKYYDYSLFEDAIADCRRNFQCIGDVGLATSGPTLVKPRLLKKNATPMTVQVVKLLSGGASPQAKNEFFPLDDLSPAIFAQMVEVMYGAPSSANISVLTAPAQPYQVDDPLIWHQQMYQSHKPLAISQSEYDGIADRRAYYQSLLDQIRAWRGAIDPNTWFAIFHPKQACTAGIALNGDPTQPPCSALSFPVGGAPANVLYTVQLVAQALVNEYNHVDPTTLTVDHGCINPAGNKCDWSPQLFATAYAHRFESERDHDFEHCFIDTGVIGNSDIPAPNGATPPSSFSAVAAQGVPVGDDSDAFDRWMTLVFDPAFRSQVKGLPDVMVQSPGHPGDLVVGTSKGGHQQIGDSSLLAVTYRYDAGWDAHFHLDTATAQLCNDQADIMGDFEIDLQSAGGIASTLGLPHTIVRASLDTSAGNPTNPAPWWMGELMIDDEEKFNVVHQPATFTQPLAADSLELLDWNIPLDMFAIPVDIEIEATLNYGVNLGIAGSYASVCTPGNPSLKLSAALTPNANVSLSGSVAIGAELGSFLGAEVGVRVNLDVIDMQMPLAATINVTPQAVSFDLGATLNLSALDGSIDAFAEGCFFGCKSVKHELYHWQGIHSPAIDLWTPVKQSVALPDLAAFLRQSIPLPVYMQQDWSAM